MASNKDLGSDAGNDVLSIEVHFIDFMIKS